MQPVEAVKQCQAFCNANNANVDIINEYLGFAPFTYYWYCSCTDTSRCYID